jgi:hypothetical protein
MAALAAAARAHHGSLGKLLPTSTALFVCDIQERFRPLISGFPAVVDTSRRMVRGANLLGLPVITTEQYPKALGATVPELQEVMAAGSSIVPKTRFSMLTPEVSELLKQKPTISQVRRARLHAPAGKAGCVRGRPARLPGALVSQHVCVPLCALVPPFPPAHTHTPAGAAVRHRGTRVCAADHAGPAGVWVRGEVAAGAAVQLRTALCRRGSVIAVAVAAGRTPCARRDVCAALTSLRRGVRAAAAARRFTSWWTQSAASAPRTAQPACSGVRRAGPSW